jgi:hypothetical protein
VIDVFASAQQPSHRLIPSQFPPIGPFDTVATAADLEAVMELVGWTNDRLVAERVARLHKSEWVYGNPNSSIMMAALLHESAQAPWAQLSRTLAVSEPSVMGRIAVQPIREMAGVTWNVEGDPDDLIETNEIVDSGPGRRPVWE